MSADFVVDASQAEALFETVRGRCQDMRWFWREVRADYLEMIAEQFNTTGGRSGGWQPLSPYTVAEKAAAGYGGAPIMQRTRDLINSLMLGGPMSVEVLAPDYLKLGTAVPYAPIHQYGGGNVPERPLIAVTDADGKRWAEMLAGRLLED